MKINIRLILSLLLFISFGVFAQEMNNRNDEADKDNFVVKAASSSMMEIELGRLAQERGQSQKVKEIGERMVRDHSKASDELKDIAQKNNIELPDQMLEMHKMHVDELSELSGEEFDRAYLEALNEHHEKDLEEFQDASENYENQDVRDWADKTLPVLQEHGELISTTEDRIE